MPRSYPIKKLKGQKAIPQAIYGVLTFNFWGNDEEKYRNRVLSKLCKLIRSKFNLSSTPFYPSDSPEEGMILIALAITNIGSMDKLKENILEFVEEVAEARLINDSWSNYDIL